MWKNLVLYRLLQICTNGEDSCKEAAKYFKCQPKCEPSDMLIDYETVHFYGLLSKKDDLWYIQNGFDEVQVQITSETVGFRTIADLAEPLHIFAAVPIPDPDADFATYVEEDDTWEIPVAMLVTTDNIYQMVGIFKSVEEKQRALSEFVFLPIDQKTTLYRFMTSEVFAKNMIRCLGFMASAKIDPWFSCSDRNDDLIEQYNALTGNSLKVDMYRVLSFLDFVGDELFLSENSATIHFPPNWLSFLGTYALTEGCSVWSIPEKSLTQTILKEVPHNFYVPTYMLCWVLGPAQQNKMIQDLLKCQNKKKSDEIRTRLIHFLCYGTDLQLKVIQNTVHRLIKVGLTNKDLFDLSAGNSSAVVRSFMQSEYGFTL